MALEEQGDPWRVIFVDELRRWQAKSYEGLWAALSDVIEQKSCCVHYDREGPGGTYQVEVQPLESPAEYLHVLVSVSEPTGWHSLSYDFIRHSDGRLAGKDV